MSTDFYVTLLYNLRRQGQYNKAQKEMKSNNIISNKQTMFPSLIIKINSKL